MTINAEKWEINLNGPNNSMRIYAGRYSQQQFIIKPNPFYSYTKSSTTEITLNDTVFSFPSGLKYYISTADLTLNVLVGAPCRGNAGNYVVFFNITSDTFYSLPPVLATLVQGSKGILTISPPNTDEAPTTFPGGTLPINYVLSSTETNFEEITGVWKSAETNDATAFLTIPTIPPNTLTSEGTFVIINSNTTNSQSFTLVLNNQCFEPNNKEIVIYLTNKAPTLAANNVDLSSWFVWYDPKNDKTLTNSNPPRLNGLHYTIVPKIYPIQMYCALYCKDADTPSESELIDQSIKVGPLYQLNKTFFSDGSTKDIYFTNLVRGQSYALTCLFQTVETNASTRTYSKITFKTQPDPENPTKQVDQIPTPVEPSQCAYFTFLSEPSLDLKLAILGYCQNIFSAGGTKPIIGGCIVCTDDQQRTVNSQTNNTQNNLPKNILCKNSINNNNQRLRYLSTIIPKSDFTSQTYNYYVCGIPSVLCNSDTPKINSLRNLQGSSTTTIDSGIKRILQKNVVEGLSTTQQFQNQLGFQNVTVVKVELIEDSYAPKIQITNGESSNSMFGEFSTFINFSDYGKFDCYYKVHAEDATPLTVQDIRNCTDRNNCGKFVLASPGVKISNVASPGFTVGRTYGVFTICYNQSQKAQFASEIFNSYKFVPACPQNYILNNNKDCVLSITSFKNDTFNSLSTRLKIGYWILVLIIIIFFSY